MINYALNSISLQNVMLLQKLDLDTGIW